MNEHALEWLDLPPERMLFLCSDVSVHKNPEVTVSIVSIDDYYDLLPDMNCLR